MEFRELELKHIREINSWHYDGIYSFYDMPSEEGLKTFLKPDSKVKYFACYEGEEMIGFYCFWLEEGDMYIGLGLKPELTGKGLGRDFVLDGISFGIERFGYNQGVIRLMVASFNQRAIKLYKKVGFEETGVKVYKTRDGEREFTTMARVLN